MGSRSQENTDVVVIAFAIAFPVVGDVIAAGIQSEFLIGIDEDGGAVSVIARDTVVVGDVKTLGAAVVGGGADEPFVGLGTVHKNPSGGVGVAVEVAGIVECLTIRYPRGADSRREE